MVGCPPKEKDFLEYYIFLSTEDKAEFREHIKTCASCIGQLQEEFNDYQEIVSGGLDYEWAPKGIENPEEFLLGVGIYWERRDELLEAFQEQAEHGLGQLTPGIGKLLHFCRRLFRSISLSAMGAPLVILQHDIALIWHSVVEVEEVLGGPEVFEFYFKQSSKDFLEACRTLFLGEKKHLLVDILSSEGDPVFLECKLCCEHFIYTDESDWSKAFKTSECNV